MIQVEDYISRISVKSAFCSNYLLNSSQVVELGITDLLLQHELLEVLSCIRLSLQSLKSLNRQGNTHTVSTVFQKSLNKL